MPQAYYLDGGCVFVSFENDPKLLRGYDGIVINGYNLSLADNKELDLKELDKAKVNPDTLNHLECIQKLGPLRLFEEGKKYRHTLGTYKYCICTYVSHIEVKMKDEKSGEVFTIRQWMNYYPAELDFDENKEGQETQQPSCDNNTSAEYEKYVTPEGWAVVHFSCGNWVKVKGYVLKAVTRDEIRGLKLLPFDDTNSSLATVYTLKRLLEFKLLTLFEKGNKYKHSYSNSPRSDVVECISVSKDEALMKNSKGVVFAANTWANYRRIETFVENGVVHDRDFIPKDIPKDNPKLYTTIGAFKIPTVPVGTTMRIRGEGVERMLAKSEPIIHSLCHNNGNITSIGGTEPTIVGIDEVGMTDDDPLVSQQGQRQSRMALLKTVSME